MQVDGGVSVTAATGVDGNIVKASAEAKAKERPLLMRIVSSVRLSVACPAIEAPPSSTL